MKNLLMNLYIKGDKMKGRRYYMALAEKLMGKEKDYVTLEDMKKIYNK